jgi:hypothetical protein
LLRRKKNFFFNICDVITWEKTAGQLNGKNRFSRQLEPSKRMPNAAFLIEQNVARAHNGGHQAVRNLLYAY